MISDQSLDGSDSLYVQRESKHSGIKSFISDETLSKIAAKRLRTKFGIKTESCCFAQNSGADFRIRQTGKIESFLQRKKQIKKETEDDRNSSLSGSRESASSYDCLKR